MKNTNVPVIMMPLTEARAHGMEVETKEEVLNKKLSHGLDLKFNVLEFASPKEDLWIDENDWLEVELRSGIVRMYYSPLKKYRQKRFDGKNYRMMLLKHRVVPCVTGKRIYLLKISYLEKLFGLANVINFLWDFHEINYYFDLGKKITIEHMEVEKAEEKQPNKGEAYQTLEELLDVVEKQQG